MTGLTLEHLPYFSGGGGPPPPDPFDQTFTMSPVLIGAVAFGPEPYTIPGTVVPPIQAHIVDADMNPVRELDQSKNRQWLDVADDAGTASLVMRNDDPDLAYLTPGCAIQYHFHGWATFSMLPRSRERIIRDPGEEANQLTTISGPGHIAKFDRSAVLPSRGVGVLPIQTDRIFAWPSPEFDDSTWANATVMCSPFAVPPENEGWWETVVTDGGWTDAASAWIWAAGSTPAHSTGVGPCYFRRSFTLAADSLITFMAAADNGGDIYLDGQPIITGMSDLTHVYTIAINLTAGEHNIAARIDEAGSQPGDTIDPAGFLFSGYTTGGDGALLSSVVRTGDDWKILEFPTAAPGMTLGQVLYLVLDEWEADGTCPTIARTFTPELDSNGTPWDPSESVSTKVGNDGFVFIARELAGTYIDVHMHPANWELSAYRIGERGRDRTVSIHSATDPDDPMTGNLLRLTATDDLEPITSFLVRWTGGWMIVEDDDAIAEHGRNRVTLGLSAQSAAEAERIAREQLAIFARLRSEVTVEARDDEQANWPYWSYVTCDRIMVDQDDEGTQAAEKVLSIAVAEDEDGNVTVVPILRDLMRETLDRHERALKKSGLGTVDGRSDVANPVSSIGGTTAPSCCPPPAPGPSV